MRHFAPDEYQCHCGRPECDAPKELDSILAERLDALRESLGRPLLLTSGIRCAFWNAHEGGAPDSKHLSGQAVDIACTDDRLRYELLQHLMMRPFVWFPFIEVGPHHTHIDIIERGPAPILMLGGG
jgi:uncharacterized protein YcbK (DUF882 family)